MAGRHPDLEYVNLRSLEKDNHDDDVGDDDDGDDDDDNGDGDDDDGDDSKFGGIDEKIFGE